MRKGVFLAAVAALLIGVMGARWVDIWKPIKGDPPDAMVWVVSFFQRFDEYLRVEWGFYTGFIWIGLCLLLVAALWPQLVEWLTRRKARAKEFKAQFDDPRQVEARSRVRDLCGEVYAEVRTANEPPVFAEFLRQVTLPEHLPLPESASISDFVSWQHHLHGEKELRLCEILTEVYSDTARGKEIEEHRQTATKFWRRCGDGLQSGEMKIADISGPVKSNRVDLKLLAFLELISLKNTQWSDGPGKRGLFYMARLAEGL